VLSGFLGAGKTTLADRENRQVAVIVNDGSEVWRTCEDCFPAWFQDEADA
jgi:G3E family GTPase